MNKRLFLIAFTFFCDQKVFSFKAGPALSQSLSRFTQSLQTLGDALRGGSDQRQSKLIGQEKARQSQKEASEAEQKKRSAELVRLQKDRLKSEAAAAERKIKEAEFAALKAQEARAKKQQAEVEQEKVALLQRQEAEKIKALEKAEQEKIRIQKEKEAAEAAHKSDEEKARIVQKQKEEQQKIEQLTQEIEPSEKELEKISEKVRIAEEEKRKADQEVERKKKEAEAERTRLAEIEKKRKELQDAELERAEEEKKRVVEERKKQAELDRQRKETADRERKENQEKKSKMSPEELSKHILTLKTGEDMLKDAGYGYTEPAKNFFNDKDWKPDDFVTTNWFPGVDHPVMDALQPFYNTPVKNKDWAGALNGYLQNRQSVFNERKISDIRQENNDFLKTEIVNQQSAKAQLVIVAKALIKTYAIYLMPKTKKDLYLLLELINSDEGKKRLGGSIARLDLMLTLPYDSEGNFEPDKLQRKKGDKNNIDITLPVVIVWTARGKEKAQKALDVIFNLAKEKAINGATGAVPSYSRKINDLIYYAQGNEQDKIKFPEYFEAHRVLYESDAFKAVDLIAGKDGVPAFALDDPSKATKK